MTRAIKARSGAPERSKRRINPPTPTSARRSSTTALTRRQLNSDRLLATTLLAHYEVARSGDGYVFLVPQATLPAP